MHALITIILLHIFIEGAKFAALDETKNVIDKSKKGELTKQEIQNLEAERDKLFVNINQAINETIDELLKGNNSDSPILIEHLEVLRGQVKSLNDLNNTEINLELGQFQENLVDNSSIDARRSVKDLNRKLVKMILVESLARAKFSKTGVMGKSRQILDEARARKIQEQFDAWYKERLATKRVKYKDGTKPFGLKTEPCPNLGLKKKKKKKKRSRRANDLDVDVRKDDLNLRKAKGDIASCESKETRKRKREERRMKKFNKYPCCRKCCKKSYMGCLRK